MKFQSDSDPLPERTYPRLSRKERKETAEWLAEMIRNGELRPAKNQYSPITIKKAASKGPGEEGA